MSNYESGTATVTLIDTNCQTGETYNVQYSVNDGSLIALSPSNIAADAVSGSNRLLTLTIPSLSFGDSVKLQVMKTFNGKSSGWVTTLTDGTTPIQFTVMDCFGKRPYCLYGKGTVNLSTGNLILEETDLALPSKEPSDCVKIG